MGSSSEWCKWAECLSSDMWQRSSDLCVCVVVIVTRSSLPLTKIFPTFSLDLSFNQTGAWFVYVVDTLITWSRSWFAICLKKTVGTLTRRLISSSLPVTSRRAIASWKRIGVNIVGPVFGVLCRQCLVCSVCVGACCRSSKDFCLPSADQKWQQIAQRKIIESFDRQTVDQFFLFPSVKEREIRGVTSPTSRFNGPMKGAVIFGPKKNISWTRVQSGKNEALKAKQTHSSCINIYSAGESVKMAWLDLTPVTSLALDAGSLRTEKYLFPLCRLSINKTQVDRLTKSLRKSPSVSCACHTYCLLHRCKALGGTDFWLILATLSYKYNPPVRYSSLPS